VKNTFRIINNAGREYTVQLNAVKIAWKGRPATLNFVRDITDQLNLEASLRQAQKMEAAHPFFEHLNRIEDCVKNATDLTRQLLGFARGGKYEIKPTRMNNILDQSIHILALKTRKPFSDQFTNARS